MRRIYFLLPDVHSAQTIINELLLLRVEWRHVHVIANHNVPLEGLPEATLAQRSDLLPALAAPQAAPVPPGETMNSYLRQVADAGARQRYRQEMDFRLRGKDAEDF